MAEKMNIIRKEILAAMKSFKADPAGVEAIFSFSQDFSGFKGHFPENPILPGICQVQAAMLILEAWKKQEFKMEELVSAKFYSPVSVNEEIFFKGSLAPQSDSIVKFKVTAKDRKVADLKLKFSPIKHIDTI